ncbi:glycerol-3-phosphate dehydrogenase [Oleiagrimonas soli]|uniref:Glycerol-3-phosphate dehydrogenase n=1 Tax=Oleiagrimonas soli TaxID=1543381 RepID=A0A099CVB7_9GAMM|nr:glycerol-3-phosphate dehydrogenase [Oleiagrimonas soli]KGI76965.1 glycerol-3-phosphate dehydrogenase [Oleiagrimonas soli]MBB6185157.1 glycerol-3-phosphate dehydrogenase [Oleiagrimonas soli]
MQYDTDILVVGGGVNGAGIARDAAGRGLSVTLCEQDDLAAHTSSASTKLIHGGLRYLEQYEFRLVAKALAEREVILRLAPHITWPMHFVLPHESHLRPMWMIRLGLMLYDRLGAAHRTLADSRAVDLRKHVSGEPLRPVYERGFVYSDGWVQDARLVTLNAMDAARRGASIRVRTRCVSAQVRDGVWHAVLQERHGAQREVRARALVNACGPWAGRFLGEVVGQREHRDVRLVKGSHIVLPRLFDHDYAYIFQQPDRRIVFAIPYETDFTLVGTTDVDYRADPAEVHIDGDETRYLCDAVNRYFERAVTPDDVVWNYSGVRPLLDEGGDASSVSRDYRIELDERPQAPLLNVFGGKITTYRRLSEDTVDRLATALGVDAPAWTADGDPLPGGDFADAERLVDGWSRRWPWLPVGLAHRWLRHYGTFTADLLGEATCVEDLGEHFGAGLYRAEVDYLVRCEWARSADDILWRRTKLGLRLNADQRTHLEAYLDGVVDTLSRADQTRSGEHMA